MDLSREVLARLYTAAPEDFLSVRAELAGAAKDRGDPQVGRQITAQRKPTVGAWVVNRQVHAEPDCVNRLLDLGTRLRAAHEDLDAPALRELSIERRQLVAELTTAALTRAGRDDAPAALRDEVTGTFDAAVADPQVAARLGRLTRPEQWSGFGVATGDTTGVPELTVIRGGRDRPSSRPAGGRRGPRADTEQPETPSPETPVPDSPPKPVPGVDSAARRRARRARDKAADTLREAETALHDSETGQRTAGTRIQELTAEISRLQTELADAKRDQERFRREVKSARNRRREARSALDRAERQVERAD